MRLIESKGKKRRHDAMWASMIATVCSFMVIVRLATEESHSRLASGAQHNRPQPQEVWMTVDQLSGGKGTNESHGSPPKFPNETDWLLSYRDSSGPHQDGQLIPKQLHKVILTVHGDFPKSTFDMLSNEAIQNLTSAPVHMPGDDRLPWAHRSWKVFNPDYEIRYFNLHYCRSYLRRFFHPIMLRAFDCIEAFAGKADLFRYLVLYREGGFYSDWKQECWVDRLLDRLAADNITFIAATDGGLPKRSGAIQNSFLGATPRHPVLAKAVKIILRNIQGRSDVNKTTLDHGSAYGMTSTIPLGRAFKEVNPPLEKPGGARLIDFRAHYGLRFFWGDERVIDHKCSECGTSQAWTGGNNYLNKYDIGEYFCPDGPSLFQGQVD